MWVLHRMFARKKKAFKPVYTEGRRPPEAFIEVLLTVFIHPPRPYSGPAYKDKMRHRKCMMLAMLMGVYEDFNASLVLLSKTVKKFTTV